MAQHPIEEKRVHEIKISVGDSLYMQLTRLADKNDKKLSEYAHLICFSHVYGVGHRVQRREDRDNQSQRD
jgi:hypothetical protein